MVVDLKTNQVRRFRYFLGDKDKERILEGMRKYVTKKQELDKFLEKRITPLIKGKKLKILDACCGIGHLIYFLKDISPQSHFLGIDNVPYLIEEAKKLCHGSNAEFRVMDVYTLSEVFGKEFDISLNWKTISWLPRYEEIMKELFKVTKKHIFVSSLFYDGDIDFEIKATMHKSEHGKKRHYHYYNVYSYPRFEEFCHDLGAKKVIPYDFGIKIDIPKPPLDEMGTHTMKLENGRRIQVSGVVLMQWKVVRIDFLNTSKEESYL